MGLSKLLLEAVYIFAASALVCSKESAPLHIYVEGTSTKEYIYLIFDYSVYLGQISHARPE